jgi:hypothetical protein
VFSVFSPYGSSFTWLTRCPGTPVPARSCAVVTVSQSPERAVRMPDARQSEATKRSAVFENDGVMYPMVRLAICRRFCGQLPRS